MQLLQLGGLAALMCSCIAPCIHACMQAAIVELICSANYSAAANAMALMVRQADGPAHEAAAALKQAAHSCPDSYGAQYTLEMMLSGACAIASSLFRALDDLFFSKDSTPSLPMALHAVVKHVNGLTSCAGCEKC